MKVVGKAKNNTQIMLIVKKIQYTIFLVLVPFIIYSQLIHPVSNSIAGNKAFLDLEEYYKNDIKPPYEKAFFNFNSKNDSVENYAIEYIYSLFKQSMEDESNGRAEWKILPFFNETWESKAQNFRKDLAKYFGKNAETSNTVKIAEWLITYDYVRENQQQGINVILKIKNPETDEILDKLITTLNTSEQTIIRVIKEIADRNLKNLAPKIEKLQNHYRQSIRTEVRLNSKALNFPIKKFDTLTAISPWVELQLKKIYNIILDSIPENAPFVNIKIHNPYSNNPKYKYYEYTGWLIDEDSIAYYILDCSAQKLIFEKNNSLLSKIPLKEILKLVKKQPGFGEYRRLKRNVKIHDGFETIPQLTISAWSFHKGLKREAASIIFPLIDKTPDDTTFSKIVRDYFGHLYYTELLHAFTNERNYIKAIRYADFLTGSIFTDYIYQKTAIKLGSQLRSRMDDFKKLILPNYKSWDSLKLILSKGEQIKYLLERLKLINCMQFGQPGGISYFSGQCSLTFLELDTKSRQDHDIKYNELFEKNKVINPAEELLKMQLNLDELKKFIPYYGDSNFILAFSYWRDFKYERTLHKVNWVISSIVFKKINRELIDVGNFEILNKTEKLNKINEVIQWCEENKNKTEEELILDVLWKTNKWSEFEMAMNKGLKNQFKTILPILVNRFNNFTNAGWPSEKGKIIKTLFQMGPNEQIKLDSIRRWLNETDKWTKLWASLYLVKFNNDNGIEGLPVLKTVLDSCDGTAYYPHAINTLLETKNEEALKLADGILDKWNFKKEFYWEYYSEIIKKILFAGRVKALKFLADGLDFTQDELAGYRNDPKEKLECDDYIELISKWKDENSHYNYELPIKEKIRISKELKEWLQKQFELIKTGKPSEIKLNDSKIEEPYFGVDAPYH